ncbi:MAG: NADH-quinone oxidoreductase subunit N [Phycisphaerae bacterium]
MTGATYFIQFSPELCLLAGACLAWIVGASKHATTRSLLAPFTLAVIVVSMFCTWRSGEPTYDAQPAGLLLTDLAHYVRWATLAVGALLLLVNWRVPADREQGEFFGMMLCSMAGVMLTAAANDLVVLFFALELVSIPTYILVALSRTDQRASEGAVKYFFLGALAAALMVYGFSFLYGVGGTTVLSSTSGHSLQSHFAQRGAMSSFAIIGVLLAFAGLSFKVVAVPFHAYVADVYEGAASAVTGLLGFLPKLAGFVAMVKLISMCGWQLPEALVWMLWVVAALTMTVGNVLALLQTNVKRILAYSSIAHSGYMLIGLLVGPTWGAGPMQNGVAALLFYVVVYGVMNLGAFAVLASLSINQSRDRKGAVIPESPDSSRPVETLDDLAGISRRAPLAALAMAVCVFSLMGFPPTAGFIGKVYLFSGAFATGESSLVVLAVIAVVNSAIGAAYYLRVAAACYLRDPTAEVAREGGIMMRAALSICSVAMIVLFVRPNEVMHQAQMAAYSVHEVDASSLARAQPAAANGQERIRQIPEVAGR